MSIRSVCGLAAVALVLSVVAPAQASSSRRATDFAVVPTLALGPSAASHAASVDADPSGAGPFCSRVGRSDRDRPDIHEGRLVHVIYLLARGASDDHFDTDGTLACSIAVQNEWLRKQSGLEWRWDTAILDTADPSDPNARVETLDVTFVQSTQPASALDGAAEVSVELQTRGFKDPDKRYLTYVAAGNDTGICGDAFYPLTQNIEQDDGQFAQVYLDSVDGCGARDFGAPGAGGGLSEAIAQQELMHNDGITPIGAPHTCMNAGLPYAHVCTGPLFVLPEVDPEGVDVMFPYVYYPLREKVLDRGNDDYFEHDYPLAALEDSPYLQAEHAWGDPFVEPRGSNPKPPDASPDGGTQPLARTIEAHAGATRVDRGDEVEISGRLDGETACLGDQAISIRRHELRGGTRPSLKTHTDSNGSFSVHVIVHRSTRFVALAPATGSCTAAKAPPVTVTIR